MVKCYFHQGIHVEIYSPVVRPHMKIFFPGSQAGNNIQPYNKCNKSEGGGAEKFENLSLDTAILTAEKKVGIFTVICQY